MISKNSKIYCSEDLSKIENYDLAKSDPTCVWQIHHREECLSDGTFQSAEYLKQIGRYFNVEASALIFIKPSDHSKLHNSNPEKVEKCVNAMNSPEARKKLSKTLKEKYASGEMHIWCEGMTFSEEHRKRLSEAHIGHHHTEETKLKIGKAAVNCSQETRVKLSAGTKGTTWWTDGTKNIRSKECPDGFHKGRTDKISQKGRLWWTDGVINVVAFTSPGENFKHGRTVKQ